MNAVRRVDGGTIVYWSIGQPQGSDPVTVSPQMTNDITILDNMGTGPVTSSRVDVIDPVGLKRYRPMVSGGGCLCSRYQDFGLDKLVPGTLYAGYAVLPELPGLRHGRSR